jgi:hypothetical protein
MKYQLLYLIIFILLLTTQNAAAEMRISGFDDLDGGTWDGGSSDIILEDDLCVYSNEAGGNYEIRARGSGGNGTNTRFRVGLTGGGNGDNMDYTVFWNDEAATTSGQIELLRNTWSATQTTTEITDENCANSSGATAHIQIIFANSELSSNLGGNYTGTLTLLIRAI